MTTYYDSAVNDMPVTSTGFVYQFGADVTFWLNVVSNIIAGQASAAPVTFNVTGGAGLQSVTVGYGETRSIQVKGNVVNAVVGSGEAPSVRVVISDNQQTLQVTQVGLGTESTIYTGTGDQETVLQPGTWAVVAGTSPAEIDSGTATEGSVLLYDLGIDGTTSGTAPELAAMFIKIYDASSMLQGTVSATSNGPTHRQGRAYLPVGWSFKLYYTNGDSITHEISGFAQLCAGASP
jgi:hypothetical protein